MAPPKSQKPVTSKDLTCTICGVELARKGDMPRHMRTHSDNKDSMLHRCPVEGCNFANLQRSNVDTHIRTHTKEKNQQCPDCEFSAVDPGSLTRHRKRKHGYVPKKRKSRKTNAPEANSLSNNAEEDDGDDDTPPATSSRASRRHHPYRAPSVQSSSSASGSVPSSSAPSKQGTRQKSFRVTNLRSAVTKEELQPSFNKWTLPRPPVAPVVPYIDISSDTDDDDDEYDDLPPLLSPSSAFSSPPPSPPLTISSSPSSSITELDETDDEIQQLYMPLDTSKSKLVAPEDFEKEFFWLYGNKERMARAANPKSVYPAVDAVPSTLVPGTTVGDPADVLRFNYQLSLPLDAEMGMGIDWDPQQTEGQSSQLDLSADYTHDTDTGYTGDVSWYSYSDMDIDMNTNPKPDNPIPPNNSILPDNSIPPDKTTPYNPQPEVYQPKPQSTYGYSALLSHFAEADEGIPYATPEEVDQLLGLPSSFRSAHVEYPPPHSCTHTQPWNSGDVLYNNNAQEYGYNDYHLQLPTSEYVELGNQDYGQQFDWASLETWAGIISASS
ncbi:hypothetical protein VNI00_000614 [Paramarasmius palmivorus]|uniref:C2H2-type domain-containing protein n=1 Tax=Paramarasmius palmivorus TaxID=297713 RepID=A0AAW0EB69_9AGAR